MQLLRKLALPIAFLYGLVVRIRNFCYNTGIFPSRTFVTPTICIGNLSVGGTGKTPMVELLVELFRTTHRIAVLSRGYRRRTKGFVLAGSDSDARDIGDEPLQLYSKFPGLIVAVDANRQRGISMLQEQLAPNLILLDDAFQHRKVRPDVSILLTAYGALYTDDYYLPAGNLRDSRQEARRADFIIVTKCPPGISVLEKREITSKLHPGSHQQILFASLEYDTLLGGRGKPFYLEELTGRPLTLVTGIARPEPLVTFLKAKGLEFEHLQFRDHHFFSEEELKRIGESPCVLTTEKDYMRMPQKPANLRYIKIRHKILGNGMALLKEGLKAL
jgi:tetraacyldisaccharide 4'-kinase